jgi:hypothetical protein
MRGIHLSPVPNHTQKEYKQCKNEAPYIPDHNIRLVWGNFFFLKRGPSGHILKKPRVGKRHENNSAAHKVLNRC